MNVYWYDIVHCLLQTIGFSALTIQLYFTITEKRAGLWWEGSYKSVAFLEGDNLEVFYDLSASFNPILILQKVGISSMIVYSETYLYQTLLWSRSSYGPYVFLIGVDHKQKPIRRTIRATVPLLYQTLIKTESCINQT